MNDSKLTRKIHMDCPICGKTHEVEERSRMTAIAVKDDEVFYEETYYYCSNAKKNENEFASGSMTDSNLLRARNAYRIKHGLLTSDEIVGIREDYDLSQVDLARLMGWGEATISRYESKAIQDEAYDKMLRLIRDNPMQALGFLRSNKDSFSDKKCRDISEKMIGKLEMYGKEYLSRQTLESEYVCFDKPSDSNGFTMLNIDKTEAAISYIAERVDDLYKVRLMKMLWYADALSFKNTGKAMTGLVYRHNEMGALPVGHRYLMNLSRVNVVEEFSGSYDTKLHILPEKNMDYRKLSSEDRKVLDKVIVKFKSFNTKEIVEYMHKETAYKKTKQGEIIPFALAAEIRAW